LTAVPLIILLPNTYYHLMQNYSLCRKQ
jgi:hypothetical protein